MDLFPTSDDPFFRTLTQWLRYLTYSSSDHACLEYLLSDQIDVDLPSLDWVRYNVTHDPSLYTLLYRHHLGQQAFDREVSFRPETNPLYLVMASMMQLDIGYTPLPFTRVWERIDRHTPIVNGLRLYRSTLQEQQTILANRLDITDAQLIRDHGLLTSHMLLYGLHLTRVILDFKQTTHPTPNVAAIQASLTQTLTELKGVLLHAEVHWLCPHV